MIKRLHITAAATAFVTLLASCLASALTQLLGSHDHIADTRRAIAWGLFILVPALVVAGLTGSSMAGSSTDARIIAKRRRMVFITGIGLLLLVPAALYLNELASRREFETPFNVLQAVELAASAINLSLMSVNLRDGRRLAATRAGRNVEATGTDRSVPT